MSLASDSVVEVLVMRREWRVMRGWVHTGISVPVVLLLDLRALLLGDEILIGNLLKLDHFGGCVWVFGVLRE